MKLFIEKARALIEQASSALSERSGLIKAGSAVCYMAVLGDSASTAEQNALQVQPAIPL